jgi:hypothetical protein
MVAHRKSQQLLLRTGSPFVIPFGVRNIHESVMLRVHHEQRIMVASKFLFVVELLLGFGDHFVFSEASTR